MFIVGELINASRAGIERLLDKRDIGGIQDLAYLQVEAGAQYVDVNASGFREREPEYLRWLIGTIQCEKEIPCCIDSPDPMAVEAGLSVHKGIPMVNSISAEKSRFDRMLSIIAGTNAKIVALCMSDDGMPESAVQRLRVADRLVNALVTTGKIPIENIFIDPLVQPIATNTSYGIEFLKAISLISGGFPGVHTICGLSNVSYGLPSRKLLNRNFMIMSIANGLDGVILDPLDKDMMASIIAAEALIGRDDFCKTYLKEYRRGKLAL